MVHLGLIVDRTRVRVGGGRIRARAHTPRICHGHGDCGGTPRVSEALLGRLRASWFVHESAPTAHVSAEGDVHVHACSACACMQWW